MLPYIYTHYTTSVYSQQYNVVHLTRPYTKGNKLALFSRNIYRAIAKQLTPICMSINILHVYRCERRYYSKRGCVLVKLFHNYWHIMLVRSIYQIQIYIRRVSNSDVNNCLMWWRNRNGIFITFAILLFCIRAEFLVGGA